MPIYSNMPESLYPRPNDINAPLRSTIGIGPRGPKGHSITAKVIETDPYGYFRVQIKDAETGEVLVTTPNLDVGSRVFSCTKKFYDAEVNDQLTANNLNFSTLQASSDRSSIRVGDLVIFNNSFYTPNVLSSDTFGVGIVNSVNGTLVSFIVTNVVTVKIRGKAISSEMLDDGAVTTQKIANDVIVSAKIKDGSITTPKLANAAVTTEKIRNRSVTYEKLAEDVVHIPAPILADPVEWSPYVEYKKLMIVTYNGNSYTSRYDVPIGTPVTDEHYWANTGNYNAQVESYRAITESVQDDIAGLSQSVQDDIAGLSESVQDDIANLTESICEIYVNDYGAKGDGITDDTIAIQTAIDAANTYPNKRRIIFASESTYVITNYININLSNIDLIGNGCTIKHDNNNCFVVPNTNSNIKITNFTFEGSSVVDDPETTTNACIAIQGNTTTDLFQSHNILVCNCDFYCGTFGIIATSVKNLNIYNCNFFNGYYRPALLAGGYAILEQSCVNVNICNCFFKLGSFSRHDIYISIDKSKTENKSSRNIHICNCFIDKSLITPYSENGFYSSQITSIAVRTCYNLLIENCYLYNGCGFLFLTNANGPLINVKLKNLINSNPRYNQSWSTEPHHNISISSSAADYSEVSISNCNVINRENGSLFDDLSAACDYLALRDMDISFRMYIYDTYSGNAPKVAFENLTVHGDGILQFMGEHTLTGKFRNITGGNWFGIAHNGGKISIDCYEMSMRQFIFASGALVRRNDVVHPFATGSLDSDTGTVTINMTYTTMPTNSIVMSRTATPMLPMIDISSDMSNYNMFIKQYLLTNLTTPYTNPNFTLTL